MTLSRRAGGRKRQTVVRGSCKDRKGEKSVPQPEAKNVFQTHHKILITGSRLSGKRKVASSMG